MFLCGLPNLRQLFGLSRNDSRDTLSNSSKPQSSFIDNLDNLSEVTAPVPALSLEPRPSQRTLETNLADLPVNQER